MKSIFFTLIMALSVGLWAQSDEHNPLDDLPIGQMDIQKDAAFKALSSNLQGKNLESKRHHCSSSSSSSSSSCSCSSSSSSHRKCHPGPIGPAGRRGEEGPTGPRGPRGELSRAYGSVFTEEVREIDSLDPLAFTDQSEASTHVELVSANPDVDIVGSLLLEKPGDYFVMYGVMVAESPSPSQPPPPVVSARFALSLNGIFISGSNINISQVGQMATISTIVHVSDPDSIVRVINNGSSTVLVAPNIPGDVVAFLTVEKLHDPNTP